MPKLELGWKAGPEQYPPQELLDYAIAAEAAGFDTIDASDHFHPWSEAGQASFVWTWLGAVAARTQRIHMGPGITCPILRYHPSVIAQASATLAAMAPGRVYLAVGTGEALNEYAATGEWPGYEERQARMEEAIDLIRQLWTGEPIDLQALIIIPTRPSSIHAPSKLFPSIYRRWCPTARRLPVGSAMALSRSVVRSLISIVNSSRASRTARAQTGKDPAQQRRLIELNVAYTDDEESAISEMKKYWAGTFVPALFDQKIYSPAMSEKNGKAVGADTIKQKMCLSADPAAHVKYIQQYIDLGFDTIFLHCAGPDQRAFLEGYGRDVLPRLRR